MNIKTKITKTQILKLIEPILTTTKITNKVLCETIGLSEARYYKYCQDSEFLEKINEYKEIYRQNSIEKIENSLEMLAYGEAVETTVEVKTDKDGVVEWTKTKTIKKAPDVKAAITLLKKYKVDYVKQDNVLQITDNSKYLEEWNEKQRQIKELAKNEVNN